MNTNLNSDKPQIFEKELIAMIAMGCRFPGGADSPEAFWKLLIDFRGLGVTDGKGVQAINCSSVGDVGYVAQNADTSEEQITRLMGISVNKLDIKRSLLELELNSLMAVELNNRLKSKLGVKVSTMKIMQGLSVCQLGQLSLEQLAMQSINLSASAAVENSEEEEITI